MIEEEQHVKEIAFEDSPNSEKDSSTLAKEMAETIVVEKEEGKQMLATTEEEDYDTDEEEDKDAQKDIKKVEAHKKPAAVVSKEPGSKEKTGKNKAKRKNENDPEPYMKRCGEGCEGCRKKMFCERTVI